MVVAVVAVLALSSDGDEPPEAETSAGDTDTEIDTDGNPDDTASTTTSPPTTRTTSPPTTATASSATTGLSTTVSTAQPTTSSSTTTTTTTTTSPRDPTCPLPVVDSETPEFIVRICGDGQGGLIYVGRNKQTGDGINLRACHAGGFVFTATNEGFEYLVDAAAAFLVVTNPNGDEVVFQPLREPVEIDRTVPLDPC